MKGSLPLIAASNHPEDGRLVFIRAGEIGYHEKEALGVVSDDLTAEEWNKAHNVCKGEECAMFAGSFFGWDVPAAQLSSWNQDGSMVPLVTLDD